MEYSNRRNNTLLSPTERERLNERNSKDMDAQTRASNDSRVRRKLKTWLDEDLGDVFLILQNLPHDQLKRVLTDRNVIDVFSLVSNFMDIREFRPVVGDPIHPEQWAVPDPKRNKKLPATDLDIMRAWLLGSCLQIMSYNYEIPSSPNPVGAAMSFSRMLSDPNLRDRITEDEKKAVERVRKARKATKLMWDSISLLKDSWVTAEGDLH